VLSIQTNSSSTVSPSTLRILIDRSVAAGHLIARNRSISLPPPQVCLSFCFFFGPLPCVCVYVCVCVWGGGPGLADHPINLECSNGFERKKTKLKTNQKEESEKIANREEGEEEERKEKR
jgi:hypothetical protein